MNQSQTPQRLPTSSSVEASRRRRAAETPEKKAHRVKAYRERHKLKRAQVATNNAINEQHLSEEEVAHVKVLFY